MSRYEMENISGIKSNPGHVGGLQLKNVYFLEGEDLNLVQGFLFVSRETGEIQILSAGSSRKHDRAGNLIDSIPDPTGSVGWQLNGGIDQDYLVIPALRNTVQIGIRKDLKEHFEEEEIAQGQLSNLHQTVTEILTRSLKQGVSNMTLQYLGSDSKEKEIIENCLKISGLRGTVTSAEDSSDFTFFREQIALGQEVATFEENKQYNIGTGNFKVVNPDIWQEYQAIALQLLSQNKGNFPIKPEALLKNAFYGGGKLNCIKNGAFADLVIIKLDSSQKPFNGAKSLLLKGTPNVQAVIRRGKFLYLHEELNYQITATVNSKASNGGCEFDSVEEALAEIAKGNFVVVVDNEDRENEGDLIMACEAVTEEKMAFLIRYTSGLVCISTTGQRLEELKLPLMVRENDESFKTAFTISVDYLHGTTTGISAYDRALTSRAIANPLAKASDFNRPGHMFPLRYTEGGVMRRMGHTEATVDLCKMAGMYPAGILCEIALDNGKMARRDYLRSFATQHGLKMITISDMIAYRKKHGLVDSF